jgi:hypothetical protein
MAVTEIHVSGWHRSGSGRSSGAMARSWGVALDGEGVEQVEIQVVVAPEERGVRRLLRARSTLAEGGLHWRWRSL